MSNLLKALKRAERDRETAKQARAGANTHAAPVASLATTPVNSATADDGEIAIPAVMRMQRDAVKPSERLVPRNATPAAVSTSYQGVGISLTLAVLFAVGFGLWVRDRGADKPPARNAGSSHVPAPSPTAIPAALRVSEAGPLQLRLDRSVDAIGHAIHRRGKAQ